MTDSEKDFELVRDVIRRQVPAAGWPDETEAHDALDRLEARLEAAYDLVREARTELLGSRVDELGRAITALGEEAE